jgi:predicted HicB family RNase H-like nuclease
MKPMAERTPPAVTPTTPIGRDVDLGAEDVRLADGSRLTEQKAAEIVEEVRRRAGRPSLTGEAAASPRISFRITPGVRDRAAEIAAREGKTVSQLAREALEARVATDGSTRGNSRGADADGEERGRR